MVQRRQSGASALDGASRATLPGSEPIRIAIPALDADERGMLREIAQRIRRMNTRNSLVERALHDIAAAVESTAGSGPEGSLT